MRKISYLRCTIDVNFTLILKLLAIIVLAGQRVRRNTKKEKERRKATHFSTGPLLHSRHRKINRSDSVFVIGLEYIQTQNLLSALHIK